MNIQIFNRIKSLVLLALLASAAPSGGADLIVEENASAPKFSSIQAAVSAAGAGDRIFIKNKFANVPYQENVTIDKPVELLAFDSGGEFIVLGSYTITPNAGNFSAQDDTVRIIGMRNENGGISATANNTTGNPIRVELLSNELVSGSITITGTAIVSTVAGNAVKGGSIITREANVIGNLIEGDLTVHNVAVPSDPAVDTLYIVGNRLATEAGDYSFGSVTWNNSAHYLYIANNWVRSFDQEGLIRISTMKTGTGASQILNNTLEASDTFTNDGIHVAWQIPAGVVLMVENNVLHNEGGSSNEWAIRFAAVSPSSTVLMNYNIHEGWTSLSNAPAEVSQAGNVQASSALNPDNVTGECTSTACIDAGNPGPSHTDHDLTRNDCGVAGGSYNFNNFWPIRTGAARIFFVKTPRTVTQSGTISAEAAGFDR